MIYEETTTIKEEKDSYVNDLDMKKITKNNVIVADYCILGIEDDIATIMQGNVIKQINIKNNPQEELIEMFRNPPKVEKQSKNNNAKKNTKKKDD